jgi:hypothetical protein
MFDLCGVQAFAVVIVMYYTSLKLHDGYLAILKAGCGFHAGCFRRRELFVRAF